MPADIGFVLNVEDTHVVSYALKKLAGLGRRQGGKRGKEVLFGSTARGRERCGRCRQLRQTCLRPGFAGAGEDNARLGEAARLLRTLSGRCDAAARAASEFTSLGDAAGAEPPPQRRAAKEGRP